ncbi:MAG: lysophospholipid acyltransferase family protein [Bryobacterales bacterium]|nr:lysophospholipid acyltransferase family protein [Bryobacterales bacterium]
MDVRKGSSLGAWLVYAIVRALFWLIGNLPDALGLRVASLLFRTLDLMVPRLRHIAQRNLEIVEPSLGIPHRQRLVSELYRSMARSVWVVARLSSNSFRYVHNYIKLENLEYVTRSLALKRGLLFATAHLGAWELSALAFGALVQPMDVVARPLDNPYLDTWITQLRAQTGNRVFQKSGTLREVMRALQDNRAVGFLLDQNVISQDLCFVEFFGIQTSASSVFAKIAARSGAPVVPGFATWSDQERRYVLRFEEPVTITGEVESDTQAIHTVIENAIRRSPEQWLWIHRRFKTRPEGEASLYT